MVAAKASVSETINIVACRNRPRTVATAAAIRPQSSAVRTTESQFASLRRPAAATGIVLAQELALGSATGPRAPATIPTNRCRVGVPLRKRRLSGLDVRV